MLKKPLQTQKKITMIIKTTNEVQQHITAIAADNDFSQLKPHLKRAKRYVISFIGKECYDAALEHYNSDDYRNVNEENYSPAVADDTEGSTRLLDELVDKIQDCLIYYAHNTYTPEANVIMTDSGFRVPWSETVRPAQQWQIEKVEKSFVETAFEFLDVLIDFLDENIEVFDFWGGTTEMDKSKEMFINSASEFSEYYDIRKSGRLFILLKPLIKEMERIHITPAIGIIRSDDLHENIKDGDETPEDKILITLINRALSFLTISEAIKRIPKEELYPIAAMDYIDIYNKGKAELTILESEIYKLDNPDVIVESNTEPCIHNHRHNHSNTLSL